MIKGLKGLKKRWVLVGVAAIIIAFLTVKFEEGKFRWAGWTGFGEDIEISRTIERNPNGEIIKRTVTRRFQSGKTLWDVLEVLAVPLAVTFLGFKFQQMLQEQAQKIAQEQQVEADKEEDMKAYFDRLSELLVDQSLIATAVEYNRSKIDSLVNGITDEQMELIAAAKDVIRARTLSILRRLGNDGVRKAHVIHFLIETDIVSSLQIDLSGSDLSFADLSLAKLSGSDLSFADFSNAGLSFADLSNANLRNANFSSARLSGARLCNADLSNADLSNTDLSNADLSNADLSSVNLIGANLRNANLSYTNLNNAYLKDVNLNEANLQGAIGLQDNLKIAKGLHDE